VAGIETAAQFDPQVVVVSFEAFDDLAAGIGQLELQATGFDLGGPEAPALPARWQQETVVADPVMPAGPRQFTGEDAQQAPCGRMRPARNDPALQGSSGDTEHVSGLLARQSSLKDQPRQIMATRQTVTDMEPARGACSPALARNSARSGPIGNVA